MCKGAFDFIISDTFKVAVDPAVFAARLLFLQPSKAAEPLDRLACMAE